MKFERAYTFKSSKNPSTVFYGKTVTNNDSMIAHLFEVVLNKKIYRKIQKNTINIMKNTTPQ